MPAATAAESLSAPTVEAEPAPVLPSFAAVGRVLFAGMPAFAVELRPRPPPLPLPVAPAVVLMLLPPEEEVAMDTLLPAIEPTEGAGEGEVPGCC